MAAQPLVCRFCNALSPSDARTCVKCGEPVAPAVADAFVGKRIANKYDIDRKLGEGGMGLVYMARQQPLNRVVCLKLLHPSIVSDPISFRRFELEAETASKVRHPNAVEIYDFGQTADGLAYIVMEYVPGILLSQIIRKQFPIAPERVVQILGQVSDVLEVGHRLKVIHRDLKPANIMVFDLPTQNDYAKLLDFGLAKTYEAKEGATQLTQTGFALGTPEYMAPEQCKGEAIGPFTDIYAMGVILYAMLAGVLPFQATNSAGYLAKHVTEEPLPPSRRGRSSSVHPALEKLAMWALKKNPLERPPSAAEFKRSLMAVTTPTEVAGSSSAAMMRELLGDILSIPSSSSATSIEKRKGVLLVFDLSPPKQAESADGLRAFAARFVDLARDHGGKPEKLGTRRVATLFADKNPDEEIESALNCASAAIQLSPDSSAAIHVDGFEVAERAWLHSDALEITQRIAMFAASGQILLTTEATKRARGYRVRRVAPLELKGKSEPLPLGEWIQESAPAQPAKPASSSRVAVPGPTSEPKRRSSSKTGALPFVGRGKELEALETRVFEAAQGHGKAVALLGESGIGKSRLCEELVARRKELSWISVTCTEATATSTLMGHLAHSDVRRELRPFVDWVSGVAPEPPRMGTEELIRGIVAAIRELVVQHRQRHPLGIVFDDIDEGDDLTRWIAREMAADAERLGALVILAGRTIPNAPPQLPTVELNPLEEGESVELARAAAGDAYEKIERLIPATGGVPQAILALARAARDDQLPKRPLSPGADLLGPVYEAQIDATPSAARTVLLAASILGFSFETEVLKSVAGEGLDFASAMQSLIASGLLQQVSAERRRFASAVLLKLCYERLSESARATLHRRAATALDSAGEPPDVAATHLERAGDPAGAASRFRLAGALWAGRKDRERAIACYRRACQLERNVPGEMRAFAEDALALVVLLGQVGRLSEAKELLAHAESVVRTGDERVLLGRILAEEIRIQLEQSEYAAAEKRLVELWKEAKESRDPALGSDVLILAGECAERGQRTDEAVQRITQAIELASRLPGEEGLLRAVKALGHLGRIEMRAKRVDRALKCFRQQEEAARKLGDLLEVGRALVNQGAAENALGQTQACIDRLDAGATAAREAGDLLTLAKALHNRALLQAQQGEIAKARPALEESLALAQSIGWRDGVAMNDAWLRKLPTSAPA